MGKILCNIHGVSSVALVCPHVKDCVDNLCVVEDYVELRIDLGDTGSIIPYTFCSLCARTYMLPIDFEALPDSAHDKFRRALDTVQPVCGTCLLELRIPSVSS